MRQARDSPGLFPILQMDLLSTSVLLAISFFLFLTYKKLYIIIQLDEFGFVFFFLIYLFVFIFGCLGSLLLHAGFSLVVVCGLLIGGFSCCGARALGAQASVVVAHGL